MLSKNVIKYIQTLGLKKNRDQTGLFVAEGPKVVMELIEAVPQKIQKLYAVESWAKKLTKPWPLEIVTEEELARISFLKTANTVLAVVNQFDVAPPTPGIRALYLDTLQDPGNLGTILRIADWFGIKQVVCSAGCAELYNSKVVQASMASIARVKVWYDEQENWLAQQTIPIYAATLQGEALHTSPKMKNGILLIGNESKGIRQEFIAMATHKITIEKRGEAESLNAAVATGIILSHLLA